MSPDLCESPLHSVKLENTISDKINPEARLEDAPISRDQLILNENETGRTIMTESVDKNECMLISELNLKPAPNIKLEDSAAPSTEDRHFNMILRKQRKGTAKVRKSSQPLDRSNSPVD